MPTINYFAEVVTTGNTTMSQNLTVQGAYTYFTSNVGAATQLSSIGQGTPWNTVYVTQANASTINVTSISGRLAINGATGATVAVPGNVWVQNSITATNIIGATQNTVSLGTNAIFGAPFVGVGTSTNLGARLQIQGNMYASNSITATNVLSPNVNMTSMNTLAIFGQSSVGIGTSTNLGASLQIQGNAVFSNSLTTAILLSSSTLSYKENLGMRFPHLRPDSSNALSILGWISGTTNAASQPSGSWWPISQTPIFANTISTLTSNGAYNSGSVLLPDERVLFVPNSSNLYVYTPKLTQLAVTQGLGLPVGNFGGGVLLPNGNVMFVPQNSNVGMYNPLSGAYSNVTTVCSGKYSGVLTANNVILTPAGTQSNVVAFNPTTLASTNVFALPSPRITPVFTNATMPTSTIWSSATWAPELGIWCAVAGFPAGSRGGGRQPLSTNIAATSPDGISWTQRTLPTSTIWSAICWSPQLGLFCATAGGIGYGSDAFTTSIAATSPDGITWTQRTLPGSRGWTGVCWSPQLGLFCAIAGNTNNFATSPNGITWTSRSVAAGIYPWSSICWAPQLGLFCVVAGCIAGDPQGANQDTNDVAATSPDGITWTARDLPAVDDWSSVCWSPELKLFCTVAGGSDSGPSTRAATSSDGVTWVARTLPSAEYWSGVTWSPQLGQFLAISGGGDFTSQDAATSPDGVTWTSRTLSGAWYWTDVQWSPQTGKYLILAGNKHTATTLVTASIYTAFVQSLTVSYSSSTGAALLPSGNVMFSPGGSSNVMEINPVSLVQSNIAIGTDGFTGLVLAPNGNVIGVPLESNVVVINPANRTSSNVSINPTGNVTGSFSSGSLLPWGNVMFTPGLSANIGMFSPGALTYSNAVTIGSNTNIKFSGSTLLPSGQVILTPAWLGNVGTFSTLTPTTRELCLSPYFNKF